MTARVTIVGLGPAGPELITPATRAELERHEVVVVRTRRHPSAEALGDAVSCDDAYDTAASFDEVYRTIVDRVVGLAVEHGEVCYAVPGSPLVLERSVELLVADPRVDTIVHPALSFLELAWARLGIDPIEAGVALVDGHRFASGAAGRVGPLLVAHCHNQRVLSDVKLATDEPGDTPVVVLHHLGLPDEEVVETTWAELDRAVAADHLTAVYVPRMAAPVAGEFARLGELVAALRVGCPWDAKQTHQSLRRHLLEEAYEVLEAIDHVGADPDEGYPLLEEELGDLLFQVFFHSVLATEQGRFTAADVARGIHDKLWRRHPHVFGDVEVADADAVVANWEQIKKGEKGHGSVMDGIPRALPAGLYALKIQKKAAAIGLEQTPEALAAAVVAALAEVADDPGEAAVGHLLFAAVGVARRAGADPETTLRRAADRFRERIRAAEQAAAATGADLAATDAVAVAALWETRGG